MQGDADKQDWRNQMVWGLMVIAVGVAFLLDRLGQFEFGHLGRYWPLLLVIGGVSNLVPPTTAKLVLSGIRMITFGAWFFVSLQHVWGLGFHNSWPILVIMGGLEMVLKPVLVKYLDKKAA